MKSFYLFLGFLMIISQAAFAQKDEAPLFQDVVFLQNGSILRGTISEYQLGVQLKIKTVSGFEMTIPDSAIKKVEQQQIKGHVEHIRMPKPYKFREKGLYATVEAGPAFNVNRLGGDMRFAAGWMFHRLAGIGVGAGFDSYEFGSYSPVFPVFLELRGYVLATNNTPFYSIKAGHGFAGSGRSDGADLQEGGFFFHPQVGIRLGGREKGLNWTISGGIKWQDATYTYFWNWPERSVREYDYLSTTLTMGFLF